VTQSPLSVRVLLTLTALEFFGPILRDSNSSHLLHPDWVGHARFHLAWMLAFMGLSGLVNLYLIWVARPATSRNLWLALALQCCCVGGFWISVAAEGAYGGQLRVPGEHSAILGVPENVFFFAAMTVGLIVAAVLLWRADRAEPR